MFDVNRRVIAFAVAGVVLIASRVLVNGNISPIGEVAVDGDLPHGVGKGWLKKQDSQYARSGECSVAFHKRRPPGCQHYVPCSNEKEEKYSLTRSFNKPWRRNRPRRGQGTNNRPVPRSSSIRWR